MEADRVDFRGPSSQRLAVKICGPGVTPLTGRVAAIDYEHLSGNKSRRV